MADAQSRAAPTSSQKRDAVKKEQALAQIRGDALEAAAAAAAAAAARAGRMSTNSLKQLQQELASIAENGGRALSSAAAELTSLHSRELARREETARQETARELTARSIPKKRRESTTSQSSFDSPSSEADAGAELLASLEREAERARAAEEKAEALAAELAAAEAALKERWSAEARQVEMQGALAKMEGELAQFQASVGVHGAADRPSPEAMHAKLAQFAGEVHAARPASMRFPPPPERHPSTATAAPAVGSPPLARALQLQSPLPAMAATWRRAATHAAELEEQFAAWRSESPDAVTSLLDGAVHAFDGARDYAREHVALPRLAISPILGEIPPSVAHTWRAVGDAAAPSVRAVKDEVGELLEKLGKGGAATARGIGDMLESCTARKSYSI